MNKAELISAMAAESGLSKTDSKKALDGFGTFSVVERGARMGINPSTKKPIEIAAKKVVKFKPGTELTAE